MLSKIIHKITGLPLDSCEAFISLFIALPIGIAYNKLFAYIANNTKIPEHQQKLYRCIFISSITLFLMWVYLDWFGITNILLSIIITYGLVYIFKPSLKLSIAVFIINITHLLFCHIHRQFEPVEKFDFTSPYMCLVIKLSLYAWGRYDGTKPEDKLFNDYQKKACIKEEPTFLKFISYCLFFPGFFTGPACDYYEFEEILNRKYTEKENKEGQFEATKKKIALGLLYTVIYTVLGGFNYRKLISKEGLAKPFLYRLLYLNITSIVYRFKFYIAWTLAEASYNLVGVGYNGVTKDNKPLWNGIENANVKLELSENINRLITRWNIRTTLWLRHCIYDRINSHLGTSSSVIGVYAVNITSAIWHGTYPGYFLSFISIATYNPIVKSFRKSVSPFIHEKNSPLHKFKPIYDVTAIIVSQNIINFSFAPFILLTIDESLQLWKSFYFFVIIMLLLTFVILKPLGLEKFLYKKQIEILKINPYKSHKRNIKNGKKEDQEPLINKSTHPETIKKE